MPKALVGVQVRLMIDEKVLTEKQIRKLDKALTTKQKNHVMKLVREIVDIVREPLLPCHAS